MAGVGVTRVADCPVCLGTFKDPRVLPCGHTFCLICITEYGRSKGSDPDCPNCRTKFQIPSSGFDGLPRNYCLNQVSDKSIKLLDMSSVDVAKRLCQKHSDEELVLYCVQCSAVICLDCMESNHRKHDCCRISGFTKEARRQFKRFIKSIRSVLFEVKIRKSEVEQKSKKFCDLLIKTELAINEECDSIIQLVNRQRRLLLEELSSEKQKVTKDLKMKNEEIETEQLRLTSFNTRIEEMLQGSDEATTFDIVYQYKDLKESFDRLMQIQTQSMGQVSIRDIDFMPGNFKNFISRKENTIGRLRMEPESAGPKTERKAVQQKDLVPAPSLDQNNSQVEIRMADNLDLAEAAAAMATDCAESFMFKTHGGLTVHVSKGDLVRQSLDAIVNPANEDLRNSGGTNHAIAKAGGNSLQQECKDFIGKYGKLGTAHVMHTSAGNLKPSIRYVIHTVGPRRSDAKDDTQLFGLVKFTLLNCLRYANDELNIHSIGIPAINSRIFGVPIEIVGRAAFEVFTIFDDHYASNVRKSMREIHFLGNDEAAVSNVKQIFQSLINPEDHDIESGVCM